MTETAQFLGYVGTYTKGKSEGIYSFLLDTMAKKITDVKVAATIENPTYLAIDKSKNLLVSVAKEEDQGGIASFAITSNGELLSKINSQVLDGAPPCHVSISNDNTFVLSANYHKGTIEAYPLNETGQILPPSSVVTHKGTGPDKRQEKAHAHYAGFSPDQKYIITVDLGMDEIITYSLEEGLLTKKHSLSVKPGSGPRHLVFHPTESYAYVMTEFSSEVIVLNYDVEAGSFTHIQTLPTIPNDFKENNQGSAIHISRDGKFVYVANRGHDSIAIFKIDDHTYELSFVERVSSEGHWPRDFVLDPTESFVVVSNQESSNLVLFERDIETGKLTLLQSDVTVPDPVCVKFL